MEKELNYGKLYKDMVALMKNFSALSKLQREMILHLVELEKSTDEAVFHGGFSALTRALGRPNTDVPNVRQSALELQRRNIMAVDYVADKHTVARMWLSEYWLNNLCDLPQVEEDKDAEDVDAWKHGIDTRIIGNTYKERKECAREIAQQYQQLFANGERLSWLDLSKWYEYFIKTGKRYGLYDEFVENCIA